ncbi:hypothetical protein [Snodgrassella sp. ESL0253]|uniref:hypothetical protein n=1 Tax=Snodgrassella sp. ESL0253 TaxID=2705031 RepID=UPI001581B25B|nr:hypothetical protein [Snodgrassella sp. ESL0253]NUE67274.1 hypothetical protein [Snodgrassella sp. ESL0253]
MANCEQTENSIELRKHLKFEIAYSFCYEKVMYKFLGRLDKLASFILLLTGMSVIATTWNGVILGSIVAVVTTLQLIYSPGTKSQSAKEICQKYYSIYHHFDDMDSESIRNKLLNLSENETDEIGILSYPARLSALAMLNWIPEKKIPQEPRKLTRLEYLAALFAGEIPEYRFKN